MPEEQPTTYHFGPFALSTRDRILKRGTELVAITPKAVDTLLVLLAANGELVTKEQLLEQVWGSMYVDPNSISQNILKLRKLLDPEFPAGAITTVPKRGYQFIAPVTVGHSEPAAPPAVLATPIPTPAAEAAITAPKRKPALLLITSLTLIAFTVAAFLWSTAHHRQLTPGKPPRGRHPRL